MIWAHDVYEANNFSYMQPHTHKWRDKLAVMDHR